MLPDAEGTLHSEGPGRAGPLRTQERAAKARKGGEPLCVRHPELLHQRVFKRGQKMLGGNKIHKQSIFSDVEMQIRKA